MRIAASTKAPMSSRPSALSQRSARACKKSRPVPNYEPRINGSLFRINRDVRFAKDKRPYKDHIDLWFWHGDKRGWESPGFFFRMLSDRLILGAGMHRFEKAQLEKFRNAVLDQRAGKALAKTVREVSVAGPYEIGGATRKSVPRGLDTSHERAGFLLHEGLFASFEGKAGPRNARLRRFLRKAFSRNVAGFALAARGGDGKGLSGSDAPARARAARCGRLALRSVRARRELAVAQHLDKIGHPGALHIGVAAEIRAALQEHRLHPVGKTYELAADREESREHT